MFSRTNRRDVPVAVTPETRPTVRPAGPSVPSIISAEMTVTGNIDSAGEVHIDGAVAGDVSVKSLVVGESAIVRGEIIADIVRVCGSVEGRIRAREVVLVKTARVHGDVHHEILSIEAGADMEGHCRRLQVAVPAAPAAVEDESLHIPVKLREEPRLSIEPMPGPVPAPLPASLAAPMPATTPVPVAVTNGSH